jgi:hypothetical protein
MFARIRSGSGTLDPFSTSRVMFYGGTGDVVRVIVIGIMAYVVLVVLLRVTGKRTLSKMNAFDLVVTVALGSTLATILLSTDVTLAMGVTALVLLIVLQYGRRVGIGAGHLVPQACQGKADAAVSQWQIPERCTDSGAGCPRRGVGGHTPAGHCRSRRCGRGRSRNDGSMSVIRASDGLESVLQYVEKPPGIR